MPRTRIDNLVFELTQACNQRCRFCYNYWRDGSTALPPPDPRLCRRTLKRLLGQASIGTISFSGGEPTLMPGFIDLALTCRFKGTKVNILTNGTLIGEEDIRNLREIGIGAIQVPLLSADPAVHEYLTGLPGSWEKAVNTIKAVSRIIPGNAFAVLVITKVNAPGVLETLELLHSLGVTGVMVNRFNLGGMGLGNRDELVLSKDELHDAFATVDAFAASHPRMRFTSGVCTPICLLNPSKFRHIQFTFCSTDFNLRPVAMDFKGDVRFCNHSPKVLGNIYERTLADILADPAAIEYYNAVPERCAGCKYLHPCNGGCRAASEQVHGTFAAVDPVLDL